MLFYQNDPQPCRMSDRFGVSLWLLNSLNELIASPHSPSQHFMAGIFKLPDRRNERMCEQE